MTAPPDVEVMRELAVDVLCDSSLTHVVDMVAYADADGIVVANFDGAARLPRNGEASADLIRGRNPVELQDPLAFSALSDELADLSPPNSRNSYPWAAERLGSLFDAPAAPDIAVVHTGRHYWPDKGGHVGEHGSLSVVQSRAPLLLSGPAVSARGMIPAAARVIDIAPTLAWLAGTPLAQLGDMEGQALVDLLVRRPGDRIVGLLWDGCNSNSLYSLAAAGELPAIARLLAGGCALTGGAIAEFPSVTLVNHTCALTGVGPGRHGIVNNAYYDRSVAAQRLTNDARTWHRWAEWVTPGVPTVFERVDVTTACINEPADSGAAYSTFGLIREAGNAGGASPIAHAAMRDTDARLGAFLDHLERIRALDSTTFILTADHGSERSDPTCLGDWDEPLTEAGVAFRDEANGFIYLGV
jgi:phosphonoacetate hydrolase